MINTFTKEIDESNKNVMHYFPNRNNSIINAKEDAPLRLCNRLFQTDFIKKSKHPTPKTNPYHTSFQHITNSQLSLITSNENMFATYNETKQTPTKNKEINYSTSFEIKKQEILESIFFVRGLQLRVSFLPSSERSYHGRLSVRIFALVIFLQQVCF